LIDQKKLELSFEVKQVREKIPEIEEVRQSIEKGDLTIQVFQKMGKHKDAQKLKF
jgi:hypothetical protein